MQKEEILSLNEFISQQYEISYQGTDPQYSFKGTVQIAGAGLHLKLESQLTRGFLFLVLHSAPHCEAIPQFRPLWNLNSDYFRNQRFDNGYPLSSGRIKESYDFYLLMRFLRTPKKNYAVLAAGEKLRLEQKTLLFYYANDANSEEGQMIFMGCAQFHST